MKTYMAKLERFACNQIQSTRNKMCVKGFTLFSIISYLYFVTNNLNNYDNVAIFTRGYGTGVESGRWFLSVIGDACEALEICYNIPFFNVGAALVFLCFSAVLVVHILQIQSNALCFCIGAITAAFPAFAATIFFSYTVQFYFLSILLGTLGVAFAVRRDGFRFASVLLFAMSLGIYQAYFPFFAGLLVLSLIRSCISGENTWKSVVKNAFSYLFMLILGFVLYLVLNRVFLNIYNCELNSYQGIDSMGKIDIRMLPHLIKKAYSQVLSLFVKDYCAIGSTGLTRIFIVVNFLIAGIAAVLNWKRRDWILNAGICFLLAIFPVAANAITVMVPNGKIYTIMAGGLVCIFYLPILLIDGIKDRPLLKKIMVMLTCVCLLAASLNYAYQSNGNFVALHYQNRKEENYFAVLMSRVRSMDGYKEDMEIAFVGDKLNETRLIDSWGDTVFQYGGKAKTVNDAINSYSRSAFIWQYFGYWIRPVTQEELADYGTVFDGMDTYPNSGSIRIMDNVVFIKCK